MNSTQDNRPFPEEIRVLVVCDAGAMHAEREMLERTVFPELRRLCNQRGIVFTDIDLQRHAGHVSPERLLGSCIEEIHRNQPIVICLLDTTESHVGEGIADAAGAAQGGGIAERAWLYARLDGRDAIRGIAQLAGEHGLRLREGWGDARTLGAWVRADLLALLETIGPIERGRALERERAAHEAFAASRRIGTLARPELAAIIDEHVAEDGVPLVVLGPSGAGKSTLAAQWCAAYRLRSPGTFLLPHHVGASAREQRGVEIARRIIEEIRDRVGAPETDVADPAGELPLQLAHLGHEPLVLILDGIDQLAEGASLEWLPAFLPPNVRLVLTSTGLPAVAAEHGWRVHRMHGLTRNERLALGSLYAGRPDSGFPREQLTHLIDDLSIATPLAFRVRLEELRLKGDGARRMGNAAHFAVAAGLEDLMARLIVHWEEDFGAGPVGRLLTALAGARSGLTHRELADYTGGSELELADLLTALDLHLLRMDGRIRFHHDAFRRAVETRYLSEPSGCRDLHARLAALFMAAGDRHAETAWHLRMAAEGERLREYIGRLDVARAFVAGELEHELAEHWMHVADAAAMVAAYSGAMAALVDGPAPERIAAMLEVAAIFRRAGRVRDALALLERAAGLATEECSDDVLTSGAIAAQLAPLLASAGSLRESDERYRVALSALRAEHGENHPAIARALGELAGVLAALGRYAEAEAEYRAALVMMESCGATDMGIAGAVNDLATVLQESGRLAEAEALYRRSLALWSSCGAETHPDAVATLSNLAALHFDRGEHAEARAGRERVVELWEAALGPDHPYVATALANLATQITRDDPGAALPLLERALAIHEVAFPEPTHETAVLIFSIGRVFFYVPRFEEAERFMRRAYELQCELLGPDHVETANTLNGLALVLAERGDDILAEQLLKQALDVFERLLGPRHRRVASLLMNLAQLARKRRQHGTARQLAVRALGLIEQDGVGRVRLRENLRRLIAELEAAGVPDE